MTAPAQPDSGRGHSPWQGTDGGREFFAGLSQSFFGVNNEIGGPEALHSEDETGIRAEISDALEDIYGPREGMAPSRDGPPDTG